MTQTYGRDGCQGDEKANPTIVSCIAMELHMVISCWYKQLSNILMSRLSLQTPCFKILRPVKNVDVYNDVIMGAIESQITSLTIVFSTVYSDADQRKHQSSAPLAFVRGIHLGPVNSPDKWPVTRKMFPFDDVIMYFADELFKRALLKITIFRYSMLTREDE